MNFPGTFTKLKLILFCHILNPFWFSREKRRKIRTDYLVKTADKYFQKYLPAVDAVKETKVEDHVMHSEHFMMNEETANRLNLAKKEGRRIIAVGTTATRTLEAIMQTHGKFVAVKEDTAIFIKPGYKFLAIDALITNFHLPKSTLIMLVSAFMGREFTLEVYKHAVDAKYRFFSFGDSMFIHG